MSEQSEQIIIWIVCVPVGLLVWTMTILLLGHMVKEIWSKLWN